MKKGNKNHRFVVFLLGRYIVEGAVNIKQPAYLKSSSLLDMSTLIRPNKTKPTQCQWDVADVHKLLFSKRPENNAEKSPTTMADIWCDATWDQLEGSCLDVSQIAALRCALRKRFKAAVKGIDRSFELRGEIRLIRSVMTNWRLGNFFYFILKGHRHKISKKPIVAA